MNKVQLVFRGATVAPLFFSSANNGGGSFSDTVNRLSSRFALNPLAQQAKERQLANLKQNQKEATVPQIFGERIKEIPIPEIKEANPHARESTAKIAAALGTNRQYVSDAKKLKETAPEIHAEVKAG